MKPFAPIVVCLVSCFLVACGTPFGVGVANVLDSPANQAFIKFAASAAGAYVVSELGANASDAEQQATRAAASGIVNGVSSAFASSIAAALRTKQGTPQAADTSAIASAVVLQGGAPLAAAPRIAQAVAKLSTATGNANVANEAIAVAFDALAKQQPPPSSSKGVVPLQAWIHSNQEWVEVNRGMSSFLSRTSSVPVLN